MFGKKSTTPLAPPASTVAAPVAQEPSNALVAVDAAPNTLPVFSSGTTNTSYTPIVSAQYTDPKLETESYVHAKQILIEQLLDQLDFKRFENMSQDSRRERIRELTEEHVATLTIPLTAAQQQLLKEHVVDEVMGLGPLEPLLADPDVADIMVNTHNCVFIEKFGKIYKTDITFTSERHLLNIIQRIVTQVGRRIDETSPMVDARMHDGSRFNAIIQPLALDGALVSIRKFKKNKMSLASYVDYQSLSPAMVKFLEICGAIRVNAIISGGTGSGKTTLLNAISGHIHHGERVITIEDAAELQLDQPHVLRLETRPANAEGVGEINQRMLVKNALRMRPDRIILGEIRGDEVIDVLSAMNTGHDGSLATIHANSPRDCLTRIENLVGMSGISLSPQTLRYQISSAIQLIIQISRMRDGKRRITHIEEVVGMDGEIITTQTLFGFKASGLNDDGAVTGDFYCPGIRPRFLTQAVYFGKDKEMLECLKPTL